MSYKKYTVSAIFMVPPLKIDNKTLEENNFINAYSKDKTGTIYEDSVYLLFKPENYKLFDYFLVEERERSKFLVDEYDYEGGFVVLVYNLDSKYKSDWDLIKQGRYSKTSQEFQNLFPKVKKIMVDGKHRDELSIQHRIFRKATDLKEYWEDKLKVEFSSDMECWEGFDEQKETLDINQIKTLV